MKERYKVPKPSKRVKLDALYQQTKNRRPKPKPKPAAKEITKVAVEESSIPEKPVIDKRYEPDIAELLTRIKAVETRMDELTIDMAEAVERRPNLIAGRWPRRDGDKYDISAEPPPKEVPDADPETRDL